MPPFAYKTNVRINSFHKTHNNISLIIKKLDSNKAHGWDNISIKVIQICDESIALSLKLLFKTTLKEKKFPDIWKLTNVFLFTKKEESLLKNYRPISLLPIFSEIFERVIYNSFFNHFVSNKRFTRLPSGFLPGNSCIAQLLSIIHKMQTNFDSNPPANVRGVFLDISKAFDNVWHKGRLYKLKLYGVEGKLLSVLECYLRDQKQRVLLNGQNSNWIEINSGVPQVSVLGPLLFLIYINDLPDGIMSICKIFADNNLLFSKIIDTKNSQNTLNSDLKSIKSWACNGKCNLILIRRSKQMRLSFLGNQIHVHNLQSHSITILSLHVLI